jgi:heterodisulfide reductase subunit A
MKNKKQIAVIGGGIAGLEAALALSQMGHEVTLIEKKKNAGGHLAHWHKLFPNFQDPDSLLSRLLEKLKDSSVKVVFNTSISCIERINEKFELSDSEDVHFFADALVVATGFKLFDASLKEEYGYGLFENVITSADLEKIFKKQKQLLTKQGQVPHRVAIIHCVGSRDAKSGNTYCSKVCCITGVKQAIEINEVAPGCEVFCFYMDLRLYGSKFDQLYLEAQKKHKIQFIRGRLSEVAEKEDKRLQVKAEDTLSGRPLRMSVDMVILLVGMEPCPSTSGLIRNNKIEVDENGFFKSRDVHSERNKSTHDGVFMAGACICPMSVNETFENARSAALQVNDYLEACGV